MSLLGFEKSYWLYEYGNVSFTYSCRTYLFSIATVTNYHKLSGKNATKLYYHFSDQKSHFDFTRLKAKCSFWRLHERIPFLAVASFWRLPVTLQKMDPSSIFKVSDVAALGSYFGHHRSDHSVGGWGGVGRSQLLRTWMIKLGPPWQSGFCPYCKAVTLTTSIKFPFQVRRHIHRFQRLGQGHLWGGALFHLLQGVCERTAFFNTWSLGFWDS